MTRANRSLVDMAEDGIHGVGVVVFERYQILIALLVASGQLEPGKDALNRPTYSERAVNTACLLEPLVGGAEYALVDFDFPTVA
jgi:hypothetical protein